MGEGIKNFHSAKAFSKWLGFTPNNKASGVKFFLKELLKISHPYLILLEWWLIISVTLKKPNPLTNFFKRIAYRSSRMKAITATVRKVSVVVCKMLTNKEPFQYEKLEQNIEKIKI